MSGESFEPCLRSSRTTDGFVQYIARKEDDEPKNSAKRAGRSCRGGRDVKNRLLGYKV